MAADSYKNTGIEWLGEIPEHWDYDRVKDVSRLRDDKISIKSEELNYLELEDIEQGTGKIYGYRSTVDVASAVMQFKKGDVLFGKLRPYLEKYYYADIDGLCTGEILAIEPKRIHGKFLNYFVGSPNFIKQCNVLSYGTKMPRVNWNTQISTFSVPLPPLPEQKAIAEYLDKACQRIDKIIDIKQKQLEKIEEIKASEIYRACILGLDKDVDFKINETGHIKKTPSHWKVQRIKRGCKRIDTGSTPKSSVPEYFENGSVEWYGPECFGEGLTLDKPKKIINELALKDNEIKLYPKDSVFFVGVGATAGKVGVIRKPSSCNQQINILQTNYKLLPDYLAYQLKIIEKEIIKFAQYTTLPILNQAKTGYIEVAIPPIIEQEKIVRHLDLYTAKLYEIRRNINNQITTLQSYRKSLIHECVTGKKQIWEGEIENVN